MIYQRKDLATGVCLGEPDALPPELLGLDDSSLADLSWVDPALGYAGQGFVPVIEPPPPPPPPPRAQLPKSTVQERVNTIGKLAAVFAVLNSQPIYFARWFAPDWPNVYVDDPGLLQVLGAAGCTPDEIARVTA